MRTTTTIRNLAVLSLLALAPLAAGCGGDSGGGAAVPPAPSAPSKDFKAEAEKEINADNMDAELEKVKTDVESDR